jgi:hypothetical protein
MASYDDTVINPPVTYNGEISSETMFSWASDGTTIALG